jgi:hypothetical protein
LIADEKYDTGPAGRIRSSTRDSSSSKKIRNLPAKPPKADPSRRVKGGAKIEVNYIKNFNRQLAKGQD